MFFIKRIKIDKKVKIVATSQLFDYKCFKLALWLQIFIGRVMYKFKMYSEAKHKQEKEPKPKSPRKSIRAKLEV